MPRYKLIIEYDGTGFVGWQKQQNGLSIQELIEQAIQSFSAEKAVIFGAGRTDAGVHATHQCAHFDLAKHYEPYKVQGAINHFLQPHPILVKEVTEVSEEFHARFSAKSRSYIYQILNQANPSPLLRNLVWHISSPLDVDNMKLAAQILIGKHDFSSFRSAHCQSKSAIKTINEITITKDNDGLIKIFINAPSFLHNQVRIIVASLVEVGLHKWTNDDFKKVLEAKDRTKAGQTAPAQGLCLNEVQY